MQNYKAAILNIQLKCLHYGVGAIPNLGVHIVIT